MAKKISEKEFLKRIKTKHGNKYDYSLVEYNGCRNKIIIICPIHGKFEQLASIHLNGYGCNKCSNTVKKTTKQFIEESREKHNNKYDYSLVEYKNNSSKVTIICPTHGKFEQLSASHLRGHGCLKCSGLEKITLNSFVKKAQKRHGVGKFDYSYVKKLGRSKIKIICLKHGPFWTNMQSHLKHDCKKCIIEKQTRSLEEYKKLANKKYGNFYDYSLLTTGKSHSKQKITCPIHGMFKQSLYLHLKGTGCKSCKSKKMLKTKCSFIEECKLVHNNKYDYSLVEYKKSVKNIKIICPVHGVFEQRASHHKQGHGCSKCGSEKLKTSQKDFIEKVKKVHEHKYDYSLFEYKLGSICSTIGCPKHGWFQQTPNNHLKYGCKKCGAKISKAQREIHQLLEDKLKETKVFLEKKIKMKNGIIYYADIFIPSKKLIIEYNGDYWHCNPKIYSPNYIHPISNLTAKQIWKKDRVKIEKLTKSGYDVIVVWESDYKSNKEKIIENILKENSDEKVF